MTDDNFNEKFEDLTEGMRMEKVYDNLADRANLIRVVAMHAADVYKTARKAGLPRRVAAAMARDYFDIETTPSSYFLVGKGEG